MDYNTHVFGNGLRLIHLPSPSQVVYCGLAVAVGTRHEEPGQEGLAHLCEHLAFKGTRRRSAVQVINSIEGVGGELNAYTGKEHTVYYCAVSRQHLARAIDVLHDIVFCSVHPDHEVEKEREVVCDEIESYEDSPAELIYDDFENLLFAGHPLGHNILGTSQQVRGFGSADAQRFTRRWYRPELAVFFASGAVDFRWLVKKLDAVMAALSPASPAGLSLASSLPSGAPRSLCCDGVAAPPSPIIRHRDTHQAHVMLGGRAYSSADPHRWPLYLLNNILGGPGLNSRLNLALRERNALVYTVESSMVHYSDTGLWSVYFGCDPGDVDRCLRLVHRQLRRLAEKPLSERQLTAAKQQLRGQLAIACDNREQFTLDVAKVYLHRGEEHTLTGVMAHIDAVTAASLQAVAQQLFAPEAITTLIYR